MPRNAVISWPIQGDGDTIFYDDDKNIKFYSKEGKSDNFVSELLMHLTGNIDGEDRTIIMSITGKIDLKKISKLTSDLNMPGSEELKNIDQKI